jgi:hypothetical protein
MSPGSTSRTDSTMRTDTGMRPARADRN